jgi:hypothetical protein
MRAVLRNIAAVAATLLAATAAAGPITVPPDPFEEFVTVSEAWEDGVWTESDGLGRVPPLVFGHLGELIGGIRFDFHQRVTGLQMTAVQVGKCGPTEHDPDLEFHPEGIHWRAFRADSTLIGSGTRTADACHAPYVVPVPDMLDLATLFVGGGSDPINELLSWQFRVLPVPVPPVAAQMILGLVALLLARGWHQVNDRNLRSSIALGRRRRAGEGWR